MEDGVPFLRSGSQIVLDSVAQKLVLDNIRQQVSPRWAALVSEVRAHPDESLASYLEESGRSLEDVLKTNRSWTTLCRHAGKISADVGPREADLVKRVRAVAHVDDRRRWEAYRSVLDGARDTSSVAEQRLAAMLFYSIFPNGGGFADAATCLDILEGEAVVNEFRQVVDIAFDAARRTTYELGGLVPQFAEVPLEVHAGYSREEILAALGFASQQRTPSTMREGVAWCEAVNADAFLITLKKSDRDYSPTTMYRDYALNPQLFQWESQSTSSSNTRTGQRYIRGGRHSACKPLGSRVDVHIDHGERSSSGLPSHFGALRCARNGYLVGKLLADFDRQFGSRLIANLGVGPRHGMGR